MSKRTKTNLKRKVLEGKTSILEVMKGSPVGQDQYEIQDPSERLISMVGSMMNEPRYYPTDPGTQVVGYKYNLEDFDDQARKVINTALEVAESESPKDLVQIAHWARKELKMRTTPQVLLAIAAQVEQTKKYVRLYTPKIINRADEIKQAFIAYRSLFGHEHMLPNSLKRGLADAFATFRPLDFVKYEGKHRPFFADVLKMVDRRKGYPLKPDLDHYLKTGEVRNPEILPDIAARQSLSKLTEFNETAKELAKKSEANWEVLVSQFGNTKEVWEYLIDNNLLGYMALLRNLRNILQAKVKKSSLNKVCKRLVDGAVRSKQLPYRFLTARSMLENENYGPGTKQICTALEEAVEAIVQSGVRIPGKTLVVVDSSASMNSTVSGNSKMTCLGAGATLAGILYQLSAEGSAIGHFADRFKKISPKSSSALGITQELIKQQGTVGYGTNAEDVLHSVIRNKEKFDRIVIFSDMQTYGAGWGRNRLATLWEQYKQTINKDAFLHTIDLTGYGQANTEQGDTSVNIVSGYSEKLLDTFLRFEGIDPQTGDSNPENREFAIEYIRKNY